MKCGGRVILSYYIIFLFYTGLTMAIVTYRRKDGNKNRPTQYWQYGGSGEWDGDGNDNGNK